MASSAGNSTILRLLLEARKADPAVSDSFAVRMAAANGHVSVVRMLLQHPDVNPAARMSSAIARKQAAYVSSSVMSHTNWWMCVKYRCKSL